MDLYQIIQELSDERDRIVKIIDSLEALASGGGGGFSVATKKRGRKSMNRTARQQVSERMKMYWEKRREKSIATPEPAEPVSA